MKIRKIKNGVTGSWTQGLMHAKHALYQLSYNPVTIVENWQRIYRRSKKGKEKKERKERKIEY